MWTFAVRCQISKKRRVICESGGDQRALIAQNRVAHGRWPMPSIERRWLAIRLSVGASMRCSPEYCLVAGAGRLVQFIADSFRQIASNIQGLPFLSDAQAKSRDRSAQAGRRQS
jgi:hypothetical protein